MPDLTTLVSRLSTVLDAANTATGKADRDITEAVRSLIDGFGKTDDTTITEICEGGKIMVNHTATRIEDYVHVGLEQIVKYNFPELTYLGIYGFYNAKNAVEIHLPKCEIIKDEAMEYAVALPKIILPAIREIHDYAFYGDKALVAVVLPGAAVCQLMASSSRVFLY